MRKKIYLLLFILPIASFCGYAQQNIQEARNKDLIKAIDSILQTQVNKNLIPGAVILIKKDNQVIYEQAYGYARKYDKNHRELALPEKMTLDHLFDMASLTKVVGTTTSIMWLTDKKQLSVDDPVSKYIKAFDTPEKKRITIRHLLTHTAGLYEWYPLYYRASNRQETYALIGGLPLKYPIGKQRRYSDLGFIILGQIIELVSGMPLEQFMQQNLFDPLGMNHTTYNPLKTGKFSKFAATSFGNPYEKRMVYDSSLGFTIKGIDPGSWNGWRNYVLAGEVNDGNAWYANGGVSGAAGLFSTMDDIQKLVDLLMNNGVSDGHRFISKKTISKFLTRDPFNNGLGWMMDPMNSFMKDGPEGTYGHTGFTGTSIVVIPGYHISVVLLVNRQHEELSAQGEYYNLGPVREQVFKAVLRYGE
jgi:CubicO group peptidase (beta-lactamase class C family)